MDRDTEKERLYIPVNIATHFEFLPGLGIRETMIGALAGVIAAIFSFLMLDIYQGAFLTAVVSIGVAMAFRKNEINMSIVDYIRHAVTFSKGQKVYLFRWHYKYKEAQYEIKAEKEKASP